MFLAPFQVPTLKVFVHGKGSWREKEKEREGGRRGKKKKANIQNSRKSRPCCAELLQLFLFLLARSSGFTFSATAVHMSRKASSMAGLHRGGRGGKEKGRTGEGREGGGGGGGGGKVGGFGIVYSTCLEGLHIKAFLFDSFVEASAIEFRCT